MTTPITDKKNLIVDTATQCNLLCKIVIDYISNKKCHIVEDNTKKYIQYEEGSFINYRDTNYEVDKIYFFSPSRHSVDGEKFDLEVNIHHGGNERIIAHNHYHNDEEDTTPLRKHFHYHSQQKEDDNHHEAKQAGIKSEIVSCILFNIGEHKGSEVNVFFNQFVHKLDSLDPKDPKISVHSNWNLDQLLPKRKSYFTYEYKEGENDYNVIVFDNIQSIESGIFELIKGIHFIPTDSTDNLKNASLFYRTNVEMITDEQYKKSKRDQIKDLLSIVRLNYMKDEVVGSKEYISRADDILTSATGTGSLSSFQDRQSTAIELANMWNQWGQGVFTDITPKLIVSKIGSMSNLDEKNKYYNRIKFDTDGYDYLGMFEREFKDQLEEIFKNFYDIEVSMNEVQMDETMNSGDYPNSLYWQNNTELMKIDNIRKSILYYNKLVKYESINKLAVADTDKFQKISPEQNTSIQGILKELITLTTTDNIYKADAADEVVDPVVPGVPVVPVDPVVEEVESYKTYYLEFNSEYDYKIYKDKVEENQLHNSEDNDEIVKAENIKYEGFFPYIKSDESIDSNLVIDSDKLTTVYKIYDIGTDILISNNINKEDANKEIEDKILLQVYRFFISLSGKYTEPDQITNILSQQNYMFILNNTLWWGNNSIQENKIAEIFNLKIDTFNGYDYIISPNDAKSIKELGKYGADLNNDSPKYWEEWGRGTLPIQSYINKQYETWGDDNRDKGRNKKNKTSNDDKKWVNVIHHTYDYLESEIFNITRPALPYYKFEFYKTNAELLFNREKDGRNANVFVDMSTIIGDKMKLKVFETDYTSLVIKNFVLYNTFGTGEWTGTGRGDDTILVNGWNRQVGDGKLNADLEMFVWNKLVGMIIAFTPRYDICLGNIMSWCDKNDFNIKLQISGPEMDHTVDNEECQDWLSNEVHYEGSLFKFWEKPEIFQKDGKTWDNLTYKEKNYIRNGLLKSHAGDEVDTILDDTEAFELDKDTGKTLKWFRHNKCRNPGNVKAAPWCYTKNPKRRWNYCVQPNYTKYIARIILVCVFIMVGVIAVIFVKYLFRFEIISKIVAALTGANFASEAVFKANQVVNNIKNNVKNIT
jgi:carbonic anhydrase